MIPGKRGEGPLGGIAPPAGHDEDDASTFATGRDESGARAQRFTLSHTH